jgi:hypothetical protein
MKKIVPVVLSVVALCMLMSCDEELDLNAPYERIPIIYGLLDAGADTQYVLINRSYLGAGSALDFSDIQDSSLYDNVDAKITWGDDSDEFAQLQEITLTGKETDGAFFGPDIQAYYVPTNQLSPLVAEDENQRFFLDVVADGDAITAETRVPFISSSNISFPPGSPSVTARFADSFSPGGTDYTTNVRLEFDFIDNADIHSGSLVLNYTEIMTDGSTRERSLSLPFGEVSGNETSSSSHEFTTGGENVYQRIAANIDDSDPNVAQRAFGSVDYILSVAGDDFSTYLSVGDPISAVGQERPTFSNINGGDGVGIFSSRASFVRTKSMKTQDGANTATVSELVEGQYTAGLCFCDPDPSVLYNCVNGQEICD